MTVFPDDVFMAIELTEKAFEGKAGTFEYPEEFKNIIFFNRFPIFYASAICNLIFSSILNFKSSRGFKETSSCPISSP